MVTEKYHQNKLHHLLWVANWALKFFLSPNGVQGKCVPVHIHCETNSVCCIPPILYKYCHCADLHGTKGSACSRSFSNFPLEGAVTWWTGIEKAARLGNLSNLAEAKHNGLYQFVHLTLNLSLSVDLTGVHWSGAEGGPQLAVRWKQMAHLFLRKRKMCMYTNFKRTPGALW